MKKSISILLLLGSFLPCLAQSSSENVKSKVTQLLAEAKTGFTGIMGGVEYEDKKNNVIFYKTNYVFASETGSIMLDNESKKKAFLCKLKQNPSADPDINIMNTYIAWNQTLYDLGQDGTHHYERHAQTNGAGGYVTTLKDDNGKILGKIVNTPSEKTLMIIGQ